MAASTNTEFGENETKAGEVTAPSAGKRSSQAVSKRITPNRADRLRIFQQAVFDCQQAGIEVHYQVFEPVPGVRALGLVIVGADMIDGVIVLAPLPQADSQAAGE